MLGVKLPKKIGDESTRNDALSEAELENYCEAVVQERRCIMWHNNVLWPEQGGLRHIQDGDFIQIAIPPRHDDDADSTALTVINAHEAGRTIGLPRSMSDTGYRRQTCFFSKHQSYGDRSTYRPPEIYQFYHLPERSFFIEGLLTICFSYIWVFPKIGVPQNGWFIMENLENPIKMDDLGVPLFSETPI